MPEPRHIGRAERLKRAAQARAADLSRSTNSPDEHLTLPRAWGSYLHQFAWDFTATLTYRRAPTALQARRHVEEAWLRNLARNAQRSLAWFYVLEPTATGHLHVHALVWAAGKLTSEDLERAWRWGLTHVRRYDPARGAAWYVTKDILARALHHDISRRLPPLVARAA